MAYNPNYNPNYGRGGYPPRGGGYRGPRQPQYNPYPPQPQYDNYQENYRMPFDKEDRDHNFPYEIGQKVVHKATGIELFVISFGREQIECRKPDLTTGWFYVHELAPAESGK